MNLTGEKLQKENLNIIKPLTTEKQRILEEDNVDSDSIISDEIKICSSVTDMETSEIDSISSMAETSLLNDQNCYQIYCEYESNNTSNKKTEMLVDDTIKFKNHFKIENLNIYLSFDSSVSIQNEKTKKMSIIIKILWCCTGLFLCFIDIIIILITVILSYTQQIKYLVIIFLMLYLRYIM